MTGAAAEAAGEAETLARAPRRRSRRGMWVGLLFMAPALVLNLVVIGGPSISNLYYAFTDWSGLGPAKFNGLDNAVRLVQDQAFWNALGHNFTYMVFFLTVPIVMGLYGAFALSRVRRGAAVFRVLFFVPYLIASVVNAAIWKNILDPTAGLAAALNKIGIHWLDNVYFFGDPNLSLGSVMFVDNWHFWGFLVVLFLAATTNIDGSRYEAARIDGANAWQEFWHVTLPGIRPTLAFALTMISLWSLLAFDYAYALTGGGPAGSSDLVSLLVNRTAFGANEAGYAAFMGLTMSALGGILVIIIGLLRRKGDES
ncbi:carbohydrate ABC transporter permease [Leifsonia sp. NPDC056665]|uniref:carbohydrate ABC transporter permease n=1 Tax=Leifsonia sp. NPDC056665 TaxID=3345901 RepID=UPI00368E87F9